MHVSGSFQQVGWETHMGPPACTTPLLLHVCAPTLALAPSHGLTLYTARRALGAMPLITAVGGAKVPALTP